MIQEGTDRTVVNPARIGAVFHDSDLGAWELVRCRPAVALEPYVLEYEGYREVTAMPVRRIETAIPAAVIIFNFGPPWRLGGGHRPDRAELFGSFVAGLSSTYALTENIGASHCLQMNLTPIGARLLLDVPMHLLSEGIFALTDVLGGTADHLEQRLAEAAGWPERFALLDRFVLARIDASRAVSPGVVHALGCLASSAGQITIGGLAAELGWSRKHLAFRFREDVGLPPKTLARLLRFRHVVKRLEAAASPGAVPCWSEIALDCGYFDQAHLIRDFRQFSGMTPVAFTRRRLLDGTGVVDLPA